MTQSSIQVIIPASDYILATVYEAKVSLRLLDGSSDELIEQSLRYASDEIAQYCNRVFKKEKVAETFREVDTENELFLSRFPVSSIDSVVSNSTTTYELEKKSGRLTATDAPWFGTIIVTYTGGYECPFEVPPSLRKAALLFTREAYYATVRGDTTVRAISHKESRITYFDPNMALRFLSGGGGKGGTVTQKAAQALLTSYTRFEV